MLSPATTGVSVLKSTSHLKATAHQFSMPLHVCLFGSGQRALITNFGQLIRLFPSHLLKFTFIILCFIGADAVNWILIRD